MLQQLLTQERLQVEEERRESDEQIHAVQQQSIKDMDDLFI